MNDQPKYHAMSPLSKPHTITAALTERMVMPDEELTALLKKARDMPPMTPAQIYAQSISFAYSNAAIDNPSIIKDMVRDADFAKHGGLSKDMPNPDDAVIQSIMRQTTDLNKGPFANRPDTKTERVVRFVVSVALILTCIAFAKATGAI